MEQNVSSTNRTKKIINIISYTLMAVGIVVFLLIKFSPETIFGEVLDPKLEGYKTNLIDAPYFLYEHGEFTGNVSCIKFKENNKFEEFYITDDGVFIAHIEGKYKIKEVSPTDPVNITKGYRAGCLEMEYKLSSFTLKGEDQYAHDIKQIYVNKNNELSNAHKQKNTYGFPLGFFNESGDLCLKQKNAIAHSAPEEVIILERGDDHWQKIVDYYNNF